MSTEEAEWRSFLITSIVIALLGGFGFAILMAGVAGVKTFFTILCFVAMAAGFIGILCSFIE